MQEMKAKGEAEKEKEAKLYAEYMTWCKDTGVAKSQSIETATNKIESLKATIQKHVGQPCRRRRGAEARQVGAR